MAQSITRREHTPDYFFLAVVAALTVFGLVMLAAASSNLGKTQFNNTYYYLEHQIGFGLTLGIIGFLVGYFVHYQFWKKISFILLLVSLAALVLVFTPLGTLVNGTNRWLRIGPLSFQPSELMKLTYLLYLAAWLANAKFKRATDFQSGLLPFAVISGIIGILLILQPATSTVIILLLSGLTVYFISGAPMKYILGMVGVAALCFALVIYITPYRRARILGFLDQSANTQTENYQLNQSLIAIGSGGITGVGYGQSAATASYLPTPIDDSIFAVVAEELGFIGAGILVALFAIFTLRLFWLAKNTSDRFGRLLLIGFGTLIALQAFVNMAATSGLIPLTGVPLPFVSYGGTALAVFLTMCGISLNVSKYAS
ncbi:MAG TPA: putative peptidoglycan glycosyltransferase FtsW [Candidatus Paceibacterota bacterium]|jgi:cell division protein FtsW|nr:putative peptidoglycan glycosyltransferase FtsW [Candidatus Paceibacterota bacterium]